MPRSACFTRSGGDTYRHGLRVAAIHLIWQRWKRFSGEGAAGRAGPAILVNSLDQAMLLAREVPRNFLRLAEEFWPGALTLVVDASHRLPLKVTANTGRIALRWPRNELVARLIEELMDR